MATKLLFGNWHRLFAIITIILVISSIFVVSLDQQFKANCFRDDALQQIHPLFRFEDDQLFRDNYVVDYYERVILPLGYKLLFRSLGAFIPIDRVYQPLSLYLLVVTGVGVFYVGCLLGGYGCGIASTFLFLSTNVFWDRIADAVPRSFGYPLIIWGMAAMLRGRLSWLLGLAVLGFSLYPAAGLILIISSVILMIDQAYRLGVSWRALAGMAFAVLISLLILSPQLISTRQYGASITYLDATVFPEAGKGGRYVSNARGPHRGFVKKLQASALAVVWPRRSGAAGSLVARKDGVRFVRNLLLIMLGALVAIGLSKRRLRCSGPVWLLLLFLVASLFSYWFALYFYPTFYLPQRYIMFTIPLIVTILLPLIFTKVVEMVSGSRSLGGVFSVLFVVLLLVQAGYQLPPNFGYTCRDDRQELLGFLRSLPKDVMIAGWPRGIIDRVPHQTRRNVLVHQETHQAFHAEFTLEMRARTNAIIKAYYASTIEPLRDLRDDFGVTHMLFERRLFQKSGRYFKPFAALAIESFAKMNRNGSALLALSEEAVVYDDGDFFVIDLHAIG